DGTSRWISSAESRADAHRLRAECDAIVAGVGTVLADDPALTVRDGAGALVGDQPLRGVVDTPGRTPGGAGGGDASAPTGVPPPTSWAPTPAARWTSRRCCVRCTRRAEGW